MHSAFEILTLNRRKDVRTWLSTFNPMAILEGHFLIELNIFSSSEDSKNLHLSNPKQLKYYSNISE